MILNEIFFDVETKKLFNEITTDNPGDLGVSIVSVYSRKVDNEGRELEGSMSSFWEKDFPKLWELFHSADRIIGFNTKHFDVPALQPYTTFDLIKHNHFDIMEHFKNSTGRRISLNSLASANLGTTKVDKGTNAVLYWKQGDQESLEKLQYYCEADVTITKNVYDMGRRNKYLMFIDQWNNPQKALVDFSYPMASTTKQMGLF